MAGYRIEFSRSARKDLAKLDDTVLRRAVRAIDALASNPRPRGSRKMVGGEHDYRLRVSDYRVIYEVDDGSSTVVVRYVRHRREAYR